MQALALLVRVSSVEGTYIQLDRKSKFNTRYPAFPLYILSGAASVPLDDHLSLLRSVSRPGTIRLA